MSGTSVRRPSQPGSDDSGEGIPASPESARSPSPTSSPSTSCTLCRSDFGVTRRKHRCRVCGSDVCSTCSSHRIRTSASGDKVRACDECASEWRAAHADEMEESVDIRMQMNEELRKMLKEKFEEVEELKRGLVDLIDSQPYLQEAPSLTAPFRFSSAMGLDRIDFTDLVQYSEAKIEFLRSRAIQLEESAQREAAEQGERRRNFGFLKDRTEKAEIDASRVEELLEQRQRLREIFKEQAVKLRSLKDRVDFLEERDSRETSRIDDPDDREFQFIGDELVAKYCPCIP